MSDFTGAVLCTKEEIGSALMTYRKEVEWADELLAHKVSQAEKKFKPSFWDRVFGNTTLMDKLPREPFVNYYARLYFNGWIGFTKSEYKRLDNLLSFSGWDWLGSWKYWTEYNQVNNLFCGGKDCYLNPTQARFVNEYKRL